MSSFSIEQYKEIVQEIRERIYSVEVLSHEDENLVFIKSTSLEIKKILELIAYSSLLVNNKKLSHKNKNEYHAKKVINILREKKTIYYPFPSIIIPPNNENDEPILVPIGYKNALSHDDFIIAYNKCSKIVNAKYPFRDNIDIEQYAIENKIILTKLKELLSRHTIGILHNMVLYVEINFSNNERNKPSLIIKKYRHISLMNNK